LGANGGIFELGVRRKRKQPREEKGREGEAKGRG